MLKIDNIKYRFLDALRREGFRVTSQRISVMNAFMEEKGHVNAEELYRKLRKKYPRVSHTTVYRTLKLMNKCDLIKEVEFGDGTMRYELEQAHHDHLVCTGCGKIIEFLSPRIELDQDRITGEFDFLPHHHRLEIFGLCKDCREAGSGDSS